MKAKLIKTENGYGLKDCELIAFVSSVRTEHRHHKLSLKNCQAIERGYDLDELADELEGYTAPYCYDFRTKEKVGFKAGFQKALEILGDLRFTDDDMRKAVSRSRMCSVIDEYGSVRFHEGDVEIIQSLQQNEWEVEIMMEERKVLVNGYKNQPVNIIGFVAEYENQLLPKLDADGCLVLRKIS